MPDATPTSTAPRSPARRNKWVVAAQVGVTIIILWFVAASLLKQWRIFRGTPLDVHPRWGFIAASCLVVFATYLVLVETWRRMVVAWGDPLRFSDAAAIWFVSALVRYLPWNSLFQVGAFAELARRRRVPPATAAGAAVINTVVSLASGAVVAVVAGSRALDQLSKGHGWLYGIVAAILLTGLLALPLVMPWLLTVLRNVSGRTIPIRALPMSAMYQSLAGNIIAWLLYGIAFQLFVTGVLGRAAGSTLDYIAVWSSAYIIGYFAFVMPAGLGARDMAQASALAALGLATAGQGLTVAATARIWLTVLEILPALVYLARGSRARDPSPTPDGTTH